MSFIEDFQRSIRRNGAPVTAGLAIAVVASFLLDWLFHLGIADALFYSPSRLSMPWTLATYPFAIGGDGRMLINLVFAVLWIWWIGSVVERDMGSARFAGYWVGMSILAALSITLFASFMGVTQFPLSGVWLPEAALTVAWATRYPNSIIQLIVFPIQAKWLGFLTAGLVLFQYGTPFPLVGVAAVLHLVLAWAIAANQIPFISYKAGTGEGFRFRRSGALTRQDLKPDSFFEDVRRREKERKEREELRKLFERSLIEDPDDKKGRDAGS